MAENVQAIETQQTEQQQAQQTQTNETQTEEGKKSLVQQILEKLTGNGSTETSDETEKSKETNTDSKETEISGKTYTEEDLQKLLEAERKKIKEEQEEQEKLKKLTPEERQKAEEAKLSNKVAELERKLQMTELQQQAVSNLEKEGYPVKLASLIDYQDKDQMTKRLEEIKVAWKESMEDALKTALKGKTPDGLGNASLKENSLTDTVRKAVEGGI